MRIILLLMLGLFAGPVTALTLGNPVHFWLATYDCEQGDVQACLHMMQEEELIATIANRPKAEQALPGLRSACTPSNAEACARLAGTLMAVSWENSVEAFDLFTQSCDAGFGWSCLKVAYPIHVILAEGQVSSLRERASTYYDTLAQQCEAGDAFACTSQSRLHLSVYLVELEAETSKAIWYHQLVPLCEQDVARACAQLGFLVGSEDHEPLSAGTEIGNLDLAVELSRKACDLGNPRACYNAAVEAADDEEASVHFTQACVHGDLVACQILNVEPIWDRASPVDVQEQACHAGDISACFASQVANAPGPATLRASITDQERAAAQTYADQMEDLCLQGSAPACGQVGDALFDEVVFNPKGARLAFAGCGDADEYGSDPRSCEILEAYQTLLPTE